MGGERSLVANLAAANNYKVGGCAGMVGGGVALGVVGRLTG